MENLPELGAIEAVDDEIGGGVENHKVSDKDVCNPSSRRNVISENKVDEEKVYLTVLSIHG